jgi:hypothetical protein
MPPAAGRYAALALALGLVASAFGAPGCGTSAVGVEACRSIETARCMNAPNCAQQDAGINLGVPVHRGSPGTDIDACISFYRDQCLHGLEATTDPGTVAVNACVASINAAGARGDCTVIEHPESTAECAFLSNVADAAAADTATADAFGGCPAGCEDFGVEFCGTTGHYCACAGVLASAPSNCSPSSTNTSDGRVGYCCN